ncbi:hypothetical protein FHG87_021602 [Trinorchestia longiramus]|nr:hypothetical protein FHG87_021602 [Trinorchestia longiramus]
MTERDGSQRPNCMISNTKLSNSSLSPAKLREYFLKLHGDGKYKNTTLIEFKVKRARFDEKAPLPVLGIVPINKPILTASYEVAYLIAKQGKPHTIGETLVKSAVLKRANIVLGKEPEIASKILSSFSFKRTWLISSKLSIISIKRCRVVESTSSERRKTSRLSKKLPLWKRRTENNNFSNFPLLDDCVNKIKDASGIGDISAPAELKQVITTHLDWLAKSLEGYFPTRESYPAWVRQPFTFSVDTTDVNDEYLDEIIEIQQSQAQQQLFRTIMFSTFWCQQMVTFPVIAKKALEILIPFLPTYFREQSFLRMLDIKTKKRNKLCCKNDMSSTSQDELVLAFLNKSLTGNSRSHTDLQQIFMIMFLFLCETHASVSGCLNENTSILSMINLSQSTSQSTSQSAGTATSISQPPITSCEAEESPRSSISSVSYPSTRYTSIRKSNLKKKQGNGSLGVLPEYVSSSCDKLCHGRPSILKSSLSTHHDFYKVVSPDENRRSHDTLHQITEVYSPSKNMMLYSCHSPAASIQSSSEQQSGGKEQYRKQQQQQQQQQQQEQQQHLQRQHQHHFSSATLDRPGKALCQYTMIYERRLQRLELISLEQRRLRGQLIQTFKYLNGLNNVTLEGLFERDGNVRTRNNGQKLLLRNFKTSQAMNFFPIKIAATWNQLPENIVSAGTVNTFKNRLDKFWITNPPSTTSY